MRILARLLVALGSVCASSGVECACLGKIASVASQGLISYNPFAASDFRTYITVKIQNTGSQPCAYRLFIPGSSYPLQFGGRLGFGFASSLNIAGAANTLYAFSVSTAVLQPGQSASLVAALVIFRGQSASSGVLSSTVAFALSQEGTTGPPPLLDQLQLTLSCTVPAIFEINIAGSGLGSTMDFGELIPNDTRMVVLQTRSTEAHRLEFASNNKGSLTMDGDSASGTSRVPYLLSIDGQQVNLSSPTFMQFSAGSGETSHRITVTIGNPANHKAGLYRDVITIRIASHL